MTTNQIELFIVDRDPIFRLGLSVALEAFPDLVITAQEDTAIAALGKLTQGMIPDILVLEFNLIDIDNDGFTAKEFCQKLRQAYPQLPILLLSYSLNNQELNFFRNLGVRGCIAKGSSVETIIKAIRRVAAGNSYWQIDNLDHNSGWLQNTLYRLAEPGKQQINTDIENIISRLQSNDLSLVNKLFLLGKKRELQAARWLANKIAQERNTLVTSQAQATKALPNGNQNKVKLPPKLMLAVIDDNKLTAKIFNQVITKISLGASNHTDFFLETDILKPERKQELLYLIIKNFGKKLELIPIDAEIEPELFLQELWQQCTVDFLFENCKQNITIDKNQLEVILQQELNNMQSSLFSYIYLVEDLLQYLVKEQSLNIDNVLYRPESPEAINRVIIFLENLLINLANGVMQVILNYFADLETLKYYLYDYPYRSSREIARFRNEISWRYRQDSYWEQPRNIFESRYRFFRLHNGKIETLYLYAPRTDELYQLEGLSWFTTIILEVRDALSPRLQSIFSLVGNSLVFVLTQVIGKAIGLIAKGILQGIGSSLQDVRGNKK